MCNAAKHSPGCGCGFGPPYPPTYRVGKSTEWAEEVLERPSLLRRGLGEMAWDERSIQAFAAQYAALRSSELPRGSIVARLRELVGLRKQVVEDVSHEIINVPLYEFGAPPVAGAKVEYSEGETRAEGSGWSLKVFGVGVGDTTTVEVSKARTFVATDGASKLVFVPVAMRVSRIATYDGDRLIGRGHKAQVVPPDQSDDPLLQRRGCTSVARPEPGGAEHHSTLEMLLAGDTSGIAHKDKRSWVTDVARDVSVQLGKVADVSTLVRVKRTHRLELAFELPSGHDYRARMGHGFTRWELPASAAKRRRPAVRKSA